MNTWLRRVKAWDLKLNHRLKQRDEAYSELDETRRTCINCGQKYTGRVCPQCGQVGSWSRYTWKQAFLNLLDIWGLGNRPMFRTLRELFYRPGYMIADYLNGHRQFYFPPFKLLAVAVLMLVFTSWITNEYTPSLLRFIFDNSDLSQVQGWTDILDYTEKGLHRFHLSNTMLQALSAIIWFFWYLSKNLLYEWLFIGVISVVCIWIAFIKVNRYNFVETYIFLTFVLAQFLFSLIPFIFLYRLKSIIGAEIMSGADTGTLAYSLLSLLNTGLNYVFKLYGVAILFLLLLDFRQFFGLTWLSTILHIFLTLAVAVILSISTVVILGGLIAGENINIIQLLLTFAVVFMIIYGFKYASRFLKENKSLVSRTAINCSKAGMLSLLCMPVVMPDELKTSFWGLIGSLCIAGLYCVLSVSLSLLPVFVYKKYQRSWLALLSLIPIFLLLFVINIVFD